MYGTKVNFKDLYGGTSNVHLKASEEYSKMYDILEDFMYIAGDEISDMSAMVAAQKFSRMVERLGYISTTNSVEPAARSMTLDLTSGTISPSVDSNKLNLPEIKLPEELKNGKITGEDLAKLESVSTPSVPEPPEPVGVMSSAVMPKSQLPSSLTPSPFVTQPSLNGRKAARKQLAIPGIHEMPIYTNAVAPPIPSGEGLGEEPSGYTLETVPSKSESEM